MSTDEWFSIQRRYIQQVTDLLPAWDVPILFAGDMFDRWNPNTETINFCLDWIPEMTGIPGQHDLPLHNLQDIKKSGFHTLVRTNKMKYLEPGKPLYIQPTNILVEGFPWGVPLATCAGGFPELEVPRIAIVHRYVWMNAETSYPGAPTEQTAEASTAKLKGFTGAAFGDNHRCFRYRNDYFRLFNCGTLIRRKASEIPYEPSVGLLYGSGRIQRHKLDTSKDKFVNIPKITVAGKEVFLDDFVQTLLALTDNKLDYPEMVRRYLDLNQQTVSEGARKMVLSFLESSGEQS